MERAGLANHCRAGCPAALGHRPASPEDGDASRGGRSCDFCFFSISISETKIEGDTADTGTLPDSAPQYTAFATWDPLDPEVELENSLRFWGWLASVRSQAERTGLSFRAYCYNASAENTYLRRLGVAGGILGEVTAFIESEQWVDLLQVVNSQLITGVGLGLKKVAPIAGFSWSVDDPGGDASMLRYDLAVSAADENERRDARTWLLSYNQGDVEATLAIRDWLEREGDLIPRIESLDSMFATDDWRSTLEAVDR